MLYDVLSRKPKAGIGSFLHPSICIHGKPKAGRAAASMPTDRNGLDMVRHKEDELG